MSPPFVKFRSAYPAGYHAEVAADVAALGADVGHDLPYYLSGDAAVDVAVRTLLGENARLDACRHVHFNDSPHPGGSIPHADDYCGEPWPPGRWAILSYFPQDTSPDMGPTAVDGYGKTVLADGPAGTCLLMHHDVVHWATPNRTGRPRYMLKYLFHARDETAG